MKVCYFGTYSVSDGYPRNRIIIKGLRKAGIEVKECNVSLWQDFSDKVGRLHKSTGILFNIIRIIWAQIWLAAKFLRIGNYDIMIVGSTGHFEMFLAKLIKLLYRKPVVFEVFISLFDTMVNDRGIVKKDSAVSSLLRWIDRTACRLADGVLIDTNAHAEYFQQEFNLPPEKFRRVFVGADDDIFYFRDTARGKDFVILFFGTFISLHGIEHILTAAKILEGQGGIRFVIIGAGQEAAKIHGIAATIGANNVEFVNRFVSEIELAGYIANSDVCLGIFGQTQKAGIVIPCKVYNCIAMKKPVVTGRTAAIIELLEDGKDALLCEVGDAEELSKKILMFKNDPHFANSTAQSGYDIYMKSSSIPVIGHTVEGFLQEILEKSHGRHSHEYQDSIQENQVPAAICRIISYLLHD